MDGKFVHRASSVLRGLASIVVLTGSQILPGQRVASTSAAEPVSVENRRVTVNIDGGRLPDALLTISRICGLTPFYDVALIPRDLHVTVHLHDVPVDAAFQAVLRGTGLVAHIRAVTGSVLITHTSSLDVATDGGVMGTVRESGSARVLRGVAIAIDGASRGVKTNDDGTYRITGLSAGEHTVAFKLLGYQPQRRNVSVTDAMVVLNVSLEPSTNQLSQVVVTGTVVPTELKAVSNAITVITAKQLEARGITKIDQLFRGDVPGLFAMNFGSGAPYDEVTMFSRGATALATTSIGGVAGSPSGALTNPIKTYVDGVELADSRYLSQIDPKSIERIEILTGPQASTIYGSNALNGVMQIFTKRGSGSRPELTLNMVNGWIENNFSAARTPQHDYSAQLNGIEGRLSYNAGASWNYVGPWTPAKQSTRTDGFGGIRFELPTPMGRVTTDLTLRRGVTQSVQRGDTQQSLTDYRETGWYVNSSDVGLSRPATRTLNGQTLGLRLAYQPIAWWSHQIEIGQDASDTQELYTARGYMTDGDTTLSLSQGHTDRRSLQYTSTALVPLAGWGRISLTMGADAWQTLNSSISIAPQSLTGTLTGSTAVSRTPSHNAGGFLQGQISLGDRLFITPGVRIEWNPGYGSKARVQPGKYGVAYTQDLGSVTMKLRGSYGRSTRPPDPNFKVGQTFLQRSPAIAPLIIPAYGNFDVVLANPELGPEYQQGEEGGVELYMGSRGSLVITRYNQTVDRLIATPFVDSVRSMIPTGFGVSPDANGYRYEYQSQALNLASIRNQGWELQGTLNIWRFVTNGTYSWTKSRTIGVTPKYRNLFPANTYPQYQPGATFQFLPEHTWATGISYTHAKSTLALNVNGIGSLMNFGSVLGQQIFSPYIRLQQNRALINSLYYFGFNPAYAMADLNGSHQFSSRIDGVLQVHNMTNHYNNGDYYGGLAAMGRQTSVGVRLHVQ